MLICICSHSYSRCIFSFVVGKHWAEPECLLVEESLTESSCIRMINTMQPLKKKDGVCLHILT